MKFWSPPNGRALWLPLPDYSSMQARARPRRICPQPARSDTRAECASWILRCRSADSPLRNDWQKIWKGLVAKKGVRVDRAPAIKQTNK
jgi:hypothetical protein